MTGALWGALWRSNNRAGKREELICEYGIPVMFKTREECLQYIEKDYGYLKSRPDLKSEPHGWKMPIPIRVSISRKDAVK